jgi:hypothetical protein
VKINLDRERELRLTLGSLVRFEELTGKNLLAGYDFSKINARELACLVSVSLVKEDRLTPEEICELVTPAQLPAVAAALVQLWNESLPEGEPSADPPLRPTG